MKKCDQTEVMACHFVLQRETGVYTVLNCAWVSLSLFGSPSLFFPSLGYLCCKFGESLMVVQINYHIDFSFSLFFGGRAGGSSESFWVLHRKQSGC